MTKIIISMLSLFSLSLSANFVVIDGKIEYEYYTNACENGDMNSCVDLGMLYYTGNGVQKNHKQAVELFTVACKKKHSKACYHLGSIYKRGTNNTNKKHSKTSYQLGSVHKPSPIGIEKDMQKSKMFYSLGCMYGYAQSCDQYNLIKEKSETESPDVDTSGYRYYTDEIW